MILGLILNHAICFLFGVCVVGPVFFLLYLVENFYELEVGTLLFGAVGREQNQGGIVVGHKLREKYSFFQVVFLGKV